MPQVLDGYTYGLQLLGILTLDEVAEREYLRPLASASRVSQTELRSELHALRLAAAEFVHYLHFRGDAKPMTQALQWLWEASDYVVQRETGFDDQPRALWSLWGMKQRIGGWTAAFATLERRAPGVYERLVCELPRHYETGRLKAAKMAYGEAIGRADAIGRITAPRFEISTLRLQIGPAFSERCGEPYDPLFATVGFSMWAMAVEIVGDYTKAFTTLPATDV